MNTPEGEAETNQKAAAAFKNAGAMMGEFWLSVVSKEADTMTNDVGFSVSSRLNPQTEEQEKEKEDSYSSCTREVGETGAYGEKVSINVEIPFIFGTSTTAQASTAVAGGEKAGVIGERLFIFGTSASARANTTAAGPQVSSTMGRGIQRARRGPSRNPTLGSAPCALEAAEPSSSSIIH